MQIFSFLSNTIYANAAFCFVDGVLQSPVLWAVFYILLCYGDRSIFSPLPFLKRDTKKTAKVIIFQERGRITYQCWCWPWYLLCPCHQHHTDKNRPFSPGAWIYWKLCTGARRTRSQRTKVAGGGPPLRCYVDAPNQTHMLSNIKEYS